MKTTTISLNVYEVGDVIKIPRKSISLESKRVAIGPATRALIVGVMQRTDKMFSYRVLADNGKTFILKPNEQGLEEYVGHIDMGVLFDSDSES